MKKSKLIFIDLFCGAGGTTTGIHNAIVGNVHVAQENNKAACSDCDFFTTKSRCIKCSKPLCEDCYVGIGSSQMCSSCYIK